MTEQHSPQVDPEAKSRARKAVAIYGLDRLLLFIGLTVVIQLLAMLIGAPVPVIMSALLALIVAFPLSMLMFKRHRLEANAAVAELKAQREARKDWIQSELAER
ncbi:DUF4229 domain-containing protein [Corynebacterium sp. zg912]|uniref:DUF4229 domain-containing protein n=1 Tax=Corynebacterium wankanglinii TaxID=2735136 RepID=A0A7H0KAP0_9CORY|nr:MULTISPECIES: DUF4229 domain-containing protein [Corynebacterium]MBA1836657.1 DUF4229 domain-containing protein [Corynebacterium wankanglinii]MCR5929492.1 DUF4229 domain-containing protein [Corynebacterium sp. zg912]QNP94356.1 DUF4229 domain-containing protein [Corynebacterium wankanglinii]